MGDTERTGVRRIVPQAEGVKGKVEKGSASLRCECKSEEFYNAHVCHTGGMVTIECADCQKRTKAYPPVVLHADNGETEVIEFRESEVVRRPAGEPKDEADEKLVRVAVKVPKLLKERMRLAAAYAKVRFNVTSADDFPPDAISGIVEQFILQVASQCTGIACKETKKGPYKITIEPGARWNNEAMGLPKE